MRLVILDSKDTGTDKGCFLCKATLDDYLGSISDDFDKYEIQRSIVYNPYLDNISDTVFKQDHIPVTTLVIDNTEKFIKTENELFFEKFRILDGLQRTWRLNALKMFVEWLEKNYPDINSVKSVFCGTSLRSIPVNQRKEIIALGIGELKQARNIAERVISIGSYEKVKSLFSSNQQWFEVWYGLNQKEIIRKMLLLNAGHKTMSAKHQIELLYLNWLDYFTKDTGVEIIRDKDISSPVQFIQTRKVKLYRFSDLVMSTLAFENGKVNDIQTNIIMQSFAAMDEEAVSDDADHYITLIKFIAKVDETLSSQYGKLGQEWFGRANVLEAFCGAVGAKYAENNTQTVEEYLATIEEIISKKIKSIDLESFEKAKGQLEATKVSIGQRMKKVVFEAFCDFIQSNGEKIDWIAKFTL